MLTLLLALGLGGILHYKSENAREEDTEDNIFGQCSGRDLFTDLDQNFVGDWVPGWSAERPSASLTSLENNIEGSLIESQENHFTLVQQIVENAKGKIQDLNLCLADVKKIIKDLNEQVNSSDCRQEKFPAEEVTRADLEMDQDQQLLEIFPPCATEEQPVEMVEETAAVAKKSSFWGSLRKCCPRKKNRIGLHEGGIKVSNKSVKGKKSSRLSTESELSSEDRISFLDRFSNRCTAAETTQQVISFIDSLDRHDNDLQKRQPMVVKLEDILEKIPDFRVDM